MSAFLYKERIPVSVLFCSFYFDFVCEQIYYIIIYCLFISQLQVLLNIGSLWENMFLIHYFIFALSFPFYS